MKALSLLILACLLSACSTTLPHFTKQQDKQSKALSVLANYTGNVLAASAIPLQYYCHHKAWPNPNDLNTTETLVSNLSGLAYTRVNKHIYLASFTLVDRAPGNHNAFTSWKVAIPKIDPSKNTVQHVKLQITNKANAIKLLSIMDFKCMQTEGSSHVNTPQPNHLN